MKCYCEKCGFIVTVVYKPGQLQQQWNCPQSVKRAWISTFLQKNVLSIKDWLCTTVELQVQIWWVHSQVGRLILKISLWEIVAAQRQHKRHSASICHSFSNASAWVVYHDNTFLSAFTQQLWSRIPPLPMFLGGIHAVCWGWSWAQEGRLFQPPWIIDYGLVFFQ